MSAWLEKNIAVLGLGTSGRAAYEALVELGARPTGFDRVAPQNFALFRPESSSFVIGSDDEQVEALKQGAFELAIVSPGMAPHAPLFSACETLGVEIWGEVELAWRIQQHLGKDIAWLTVTGTNGKTTTVGILGSILEAAQIPSAVVGNVGQPIVTTIMRTDVEALAVELSSFQLFSTKTVQPVASVCLNADVDHLDWHGSREHYLACKARVYENTEIACVYDAQDLSVENMVAQADVVEGARAIGYTLDTPGVYQVGMVADEDAAYFVDRAFSSSPYTHAVALATVSDLEGFAGPCPSSAILKDTLAAIALARALGQKDSRFEVGEDAVTQGLVSYHSAGHRREIVDHVADMWWIDDSKATNAHAAAASMKGFDPKTVIWIAGGDAKGQDFHALVREIEPYLRGVVVIGADPSRVVTALSDEAPHTPYVVVNEHEDWMFSVVNEAVALSRPGDTVMLSPACASWDQFDSYAQRGEVFQQAVARLKTAWLSQDRGGGS